MNAAHESVSRRERRGDLFDLTRRTAYRGHTRPRVAVDGYLVRAHHSLLPVFLITVIGASSGLPTGSTRFGQGGAVGVPGSVVPLICPILLTLNTSIAMDFPPLPKKPVGETTALPNTP